MRAEGARLISAVRLRRFWGGVLLALAAFSPAAASELPSDAAILDAFGKIAFGNEYVAEADPRLQKWVQPIRWRSYEYVPLEREERAFFQRHIVRLGRLTRHDIKPAETWPESNFIVLFVAEERYEVAIDRYLASGRKHLLPRLASTTCLGILRNHRETHAIELAVAIIPVERARTRGLMNSCIAEETTQVLGLLNDTDAPGTLFNDKGDARDLTPLDELLLHLLYDPRLKPGMRRAEAMAIARRILPALRPAAR
jgi:hypothetical protein